MINPLLKRVAMPTFSFLKTPSNQETSNRIQNTATMKLASKAMKNKIELSVLIKEPNISVVNGTRFKDSNSAKMTVSESVTVRIIFCEKPR